MARVIITNWNRGLQTIAMTKLIQASTSLGLKEAKHCTDRVLDGEVVTLFVEDEHQARQLAEQLQAVGAVAKIEQV